jgi:CRP-like cAMP-binding protein
LVQIVDTAASPTEAKPPDAWLATLFPGLAEPLLADSAKQLRPMQFPAGAAIMRVGEPADCLYVITRGEVDIVRENSAGGKAPLATLGPGQFFGEIGLLSGERRSASVYAASDVDLLALDRETFRQIAVGQGSDRLVTADWRQSWDQAVRASCHALASAHGSVRSIDLVGRPVREAGPLWLLQLIQMARRTGTEYGIRVRVGQRGGRPTVHFDLTSLV